MATRCSVCNVWRDKICPNCGEGPDRKRRMILVYGWQAIEGRIAIGFGFTANQTGILFFVGPFSVGFVFRYDD